MNWLFFLAIYCFVDAFVNYRGDVWDYFVLWTSGFVYCKFSRCCNCYLSPDHCV